MAKTSPRKHVPWLESESERELRSRKAFADSLPPQKVSVYQANWIEFQKNEADRSRGEIKNVFKHISRSCCWLLKEDEAKRSPALHWAVCVGCEWNEQHGKTSAQGEIVDFYFKLIFNARKGRWRGRGSARIWYLSDVLFVITLSFFWSIVLLPELLVCSAFFLLFVLRSLCSLRFFISLYGRPPRLSLTSQSARYYEAIKRLTQSFIRIVASLFCFASIFGVLRRSVRSGRGRKHATKGNFRLSERARDGLLSRMFRLLCVCSRLEQVLKPVSGVRKSRSSKISFTNNWLIIIYWTGDCFWHVQWWIQLSICLWNLGFRRRNSFVKCLILG